MFGNRIYIDDAIRTTPTKEEKKKKRRKKKILGVLLCITCKFGQNWTEKLENELA